MKTNEMAMDALMNAKETKENLFRKLLMMKQEIAVLGAQWGDTKNECFLASINDIERAYVSACQDVQYYENLLKKR